MVHKYIRHIYLFISLFLINACSTTNFQTRDQLYDVEVAILMPTTGPEANDSAEYIYMLKRGLADGAQARLNIEVYDAATPEILSQSLEKIFDKGTDIILGPTYSDPTKIVVEQIAGKTAIAFSLSNNPALANKQNYIFGHAPMRQLQQLVQFACDKKYQNFITLLPEGRWAQRTNKIVEEFIKSNGKKLNSSIFYSGDDNESLAEAVNRASTIVDQLNEDVNSNTKPVIILSDDRKTLDKLLDIVKLYKLDKKAVLISDNRANFEADSPIDIIYTGSTELIESNFLAKSYRAGITEVNFMHILCYDLGKMVSSNIGKYYNRDQFIERINDHQGFAGIAAKNTYFIDNIAKRKYQIIQRKGNKYIERGR